MGLNQLDDALEAGTNIERKRIEGRLHVLVEELYRP
jgi:hypothetical protein